ncbi:MAG: type IV pilus assembly protein PilM [Limisphaerales bacterium]
MLNTKSFLAVDFGAGSLKLAEFEPNEAGGLRLRQYAIKPLGAEGSQESTREAAILAALKEVLSEKSFGAKQINVCAPGFHVFSKFVKLPPVDTSKVTQIIRYEAQQNVPFPLEEVVWDYQILGTSPTNELEVLLVAVKAEIVEGLFRVAEGAGLKLKLVDVSPAALCNAFRYNYGDLEGCTMLLDIGAKTSNLLFFEKGKVYSRSINIGANAITQEFGNEAKLKFAEAEAVKVDKGFVSLGGAYEEPDDPQAAAISKIARQVMTRLHIQVNQTIQFYRGQQGGAAPQQLFLSGGASIMPYTAQFFAEKLNLAVEYFNPFRNIEIDPTIDLEELSKYAHSFGEVVGLGLRDLAHCPVELNLMPKSSIQRQEFSQKKPFFIAAVYALALMVFAVWWAESRIVTLRKNKLEELRASLGPLKQKAGELKAAMSDTRALQEQGNQLGGLGEDRDYWAKLLMELRRVMMQSELKTKAAMKTNAPNIEIGVWVEEFSPIYPNGTPFIAGAADNPGGGGGGGNAGVMGNAARYGLAERSPAPAPQAATPTAPGGGNPNEVSSVTFRCRAVEQSLEVANSALAYQVQDELKASPYFVPPIQLGTLERKKEESTNTFTFTVTVNLKKPAKL